MKEYKYKINGNEYTVAIDNIEGNIAHIQLNGVAYDVELPEQPKAAPAVKRVAVSDAPAAAPKPARKAAPAAAGGHVIESPLPGVIKDIFVKVGQQVKADDVVCILEAMKMVTRFMPALTVLSRASRYRRRIRYSRVTQSW